MAVKLRTRLFLVVAVLLGASIAVSALLSRRATLVEVRAVVSRTTGTPDGTPALDRAAAAVEQSAAGDLGVALAAIERDTSRRIVVADADRRIVATSGPSLASARVIELTPDGTFVAETGQGATRSVLEIRGAPARRVVTPDGRSLIVLLLPGGEDAGDLPPPRGTPLWVWTTIATGLIAVPLVFAVARRILNPISAITDAAQRMQSGELDVRVDVGGSDELAELGRAFNGMAARVAENERLRKQMATDVAHELRSPVTNLRCTLESIQDGLVAPDRASIDALHDETLFLQRLIADVQDVALAEAGQLGLKREPLDLAAVIRRAVAPTAGVDRTSRVRVDLPDVLPPVDGDADRLEQVFRNLVANAQTHTANGGEIAIRADYDETSVRVEVADTGRGIEAADLPHVFDRFYRADRSRSRATGGAGLGLAIARQIVAAHGGQVSAASEGAGRGARFTVTLPLGNLQ